MKGDFLIKIHDTSPSGEAAIDKLLLSLGGIMLGGGMPGGYVKYDDCYVVRSLGGGFVRFACEKQGYAQVVGDAPDPAPWDLGEAS